jgi:hypothetical protein
MANQQLVDYIRSQLAVGVTKKDLQKAITDAGWASADSQAAFDVVEEKALPRPAMPAPVQPSSIPAIERMPARPARKPRSRAWIWILAVVIVVIVVIAGAFYFVPSLRAMIGLGDKPVSTNSLVPVQETVTTPQEASSTTATTTTPIATSSATTTP